MDRIEDFPMRVLHLEDDAGEARLLQESMRDLDAAARFESVRANDLATARVLLRQGGFDVLLADLNLPDSQGLDTLRILRKADPMMPIVVLSGLDDESVALQALREGAQDYLVKGRFSAGVISRVLRNSIERADIQIRLREQRRVSKRPNATSRARLVHVAPEEHAAALAAHLEHAANDGHMVVLVCFDKPHEDARELLHRAGVPTSNIVFVDVTGEQTAGDPRQRALPKLDVIALRIESACGQMGPRSQVVLDCLNRLVERNSSEATLHFMHYIGNRIRALGINIDFLVLDDAIGRALSPSAARAVDTVTSVTPRPKPRTAAHVR